jgi:2-polyprenyl-3-methyl-5-hydroxy-6-metoxy-1,4-benzoquinol methylase
MPPKPHSPTKILTSNPKLNAIMIDFNQQNRFQYIASNLHSLITQNASTTNTYSIADIGAGMGTLNQYLTTQYKYSMLNIETTKTIKLKNLIIADGRNLPLKDKAIDYIVSSDVLEHINSKDRPLFLAELLRCARLGTILTYSNLHHANPQKSAIKIFEALYPATPLWYTEHNSNALVDNKTIISISQKHNSKVTNHRPIGGFFAVTFTGLALITPHKGKLQAIVNIVAYLLLKIIDRSPYYNFGITITKNTATKRKTK